MATPEELDKTHHQKIRELNDLLREVSIRRYDYGMAVYAPFDLDVPLGERGEWKVVFESVSEWSAKLFNLHQPTDRHILAGNYLALMRGGTVVMSCTPREVMDLNPFVYMAAADSCRNVLINGLGLGIAIERTIRLVDHITVVEKSEDVIALVGEHYRQKYGDKVEIIHADAFEYQPPENIRYGAVWHDIWDNICSDNLPEMNNLEAKYTPYADWQGCWCKQECIEAKRLGYG